PLKTKPKTLVEQFEAEVAALREELAQRQQQLAEAEARYLRLDPITDARERAQLRASGEFLSSAIDSLNRKLRDQLERINTFRGEQKTASRRVIRTAETLAAAYTDQELTEAEREHANALQALFTYDGDTGHLAAANELRLREVARAGDV